MDQVVHDIGHAPGRAGGMVPIPWLCFARSGNATIPETTNRVVRSSSAYRRSIRVVLFMGPFIEELAPYVPGAQGFHVRIGNWSR